MMQSFRHINPGPPPYPPLSRIFSFTIYQLLSESHCAIDQACMSGSWWSHYMTALQTLLDLSLLSTCQRYIMDYLNLSHIWYCQNRFLIKCISEDILCIILMYITIYDIIKYMYKDILWILIYITCMILLSACKEIYYGLSQFIISCIPIPY